MFDEEKKAKLAEERTLEREIHTMPKRELQALYKEIGDVLGVEPSTVDDLNLEFELVEQYGKTKDLMDEVLTDVTVPANQRAQVANAVVTALSHLVKLQEDLRREETLKIMESCLVESLKVLPEATKAQFFDEYARLATKAGLQ
jgi:uncharacterized protein (UPF0147 family)